MKWKCNEKTDAQGRKGEINREGVWIGGGGGAMSMEERWCHEQNREIRRTHRWKGEVDEFGVENTESEPHVPNAGLEAVVPSKMNHIHVLYPRETSGLTSNLRHFLKKVQYKVEKVSE